MSTEYFHQFDPQEWITQAEAARMRRVSRQAINKLLKDNRLTFVEFGGVVLVRKADVENFQPKNSGRPKKTK